MAETKVAQLGLLLRCYEGLRNWRALAMLAAGFVAAVLLMALSAVVAVKLGYGHLDMAKWLGGLLMLAAVLVVLIGGNGAGLLLVDQADGRPLRSFGAAFFGGIGVTLQSIACLLILGAGLLVVVLSLWALSFLSRIPGIGGLFAFLLAGPSMLVLAFCYAVLVFGVLLTCVAVWRGEGIVGSIGRAIDIVVKRPLDTVLHFVVLNLLIVPIELFVFVVMTGGSVLTQAMYASGSYGGGYMYGGNPLGAMLSAGASAAGVSIGMVIAVVFALFVLISMLGFILIYDSLATGIDATSADFLRRQAREVKAKVEEHRPRAGTVAPAALPGPGKCAQCGTELAPDDRFCGGCGAATG